MTARAMKSFAGLSATLTFHEDGLRAVAQDGCIEFPRGGLLVNLEHEAMPG